MAVPTSYLTTTKNTAAIFDAIQRAGVPERFTFEFLKQLGFPSSADRPMIPVLKSIGFLSDSSAPTERYRQFKDKSIAKAVLAQGIRDGYADVFAIETQAYGKSTAEISGVFARLSDKGEAVTSKMATTFKALCGLADFNVSAITQAPPVPKLEETPPAATHGSSPARQNDDARSVLALRHDIHVHLPLSTDVAVYDAIFKSLKANLLWPHRTRRFKRFCSDRFRQIRLSKRVTNNRLRTRRMRF